jgi:mannosyltransferase OCH1-like enzyme
MDLFGIRTWEGTFVYFNAVSGKLVHAELHTMNDLVYIKKAGDKISFVFSGLAGESELVAKLLSGAFEVVSNSDTFSIRVRGWLCADPSGLVIDDRDEALTFERFNLVPEREVASRLTGGVAAANGIPRRYREFLIPKYIHQIYISQAQNSTSVPDELIQNRNNLISRNPEFSYTLWTHKDIHDAIYDWYGWNILSAYLKINPHYGAARADFFRYLLIYKKGGVYFDIKSGPSKSLEDVFSPTDGYILSQWDNTLRPVDCGLHPELADIPGGEYQQWFIISEAGHPYLEAVIKTVLRNIYLYRRDTFGVGREGVLRTTGPIPYTLAIQSIIDQQKHRFIKSESDGLVYQAIRSPTTGIHYSVLREDVIL